MAKVQSVEPQIADLANGWLKSYRLNYKLQQESLNAEIDQALNEYHSKSGGKGGNIPDAKLLLRDKNLKDVPILIEYKGYKDKLVIPCLTSSFNNQGLNYYAPRRGATILKDVISIPKNSDVYRAYYQSSEFTVLSDAYAIKWKYDDRRLTREQYLFLVMCINKVTDLPIYSHKNKLGGWEKVVKNKKILLPQLNGEIDFDYMHKLISAIQKMAIKDVVEYTKKYTNETSFS